MKRGQQIKMKRTKGWGGRRRGAGRPRVSTELSHTKRERVTAHVPVHITMRLKPLPVSLRTKRLFAAFKRAAHGARDYGLHLNQFSLMGNHLHFIAEARGNRGLANGMRSFAGRLGKLIRAAPRVAQGRCLPGATTCTLSRRQPSTTGRWRTCC